MYATCVYVCYVAFLYAWNAFAKTHAADESLPLREMRQCDNLCVCVCMIHLLCVGVEGLYEHKHRE